MTLDLSNTIDLQKFESYGSKLIEKSAKVELKEIRPKRSIKQNAYLHVVLQLWAINYGCNLYEAKTDLKRDYGLYYEKNGNKYLVSSRDLNSKELGDWIEWIRNKSATDMGVYVPTAEEYLANQFSIDNDIKRHKEFL